MAKLSCFELFCSSLLALQWCQDYLTHRVLIITSFWCLIELFAGVLKQILESLLGWAIKVMHSDCICKKGRASSTGAATPHLADLAGARIAICDEADEDAVLDEETVTRMTGDSKMTARMLYKNFTPFNPTHLPILLANHLPKINSNDPAMLRRLVVVPFNMLFMTAEKVDYENPQHRLMDKQLKDKLVTTECQQQLLTWLVKGAVAWHKDGLPLLPDKMKGAMQSYVADNDPLQDFLSADCELGADYEIMTTVFHAKFKSKHPCTDKQLIKWMQDKGFDKRQSRSPSFPARAMAWQGVRIREIHQDVYQNVQLVMDPDDEQWSETDELLYFKLSRMFSMTNSHLILW